LCPLHFRRGKPADVKFVEEVSRAKEKKEEEQPKKKALRKEADLLDPKTNSFALEKV